VAKAAKLSRLDRRYWLVEEFRVSVFAQELGTAETVSAVKLERELAGNGIRTPIPAESAHANEKGRNSADSTSSRQAIPPDKEDPESTPERKSVPAKKSAPLKSLGALDALLRKS
jgi:ATP-dependent helicase HrpA